MQAILLPNGEAYTQVPDTKRIDAIWPMRMQMDNGQGCSHRCGECKVRHFQGASTQTLSDRLGKRTKVFAPPRRAIRQAADSDVM